MKRLIILIFLSFLSCTSYKNLQEGDLLFQDLDNSALSESIEKATSDKTDFQISHMGILVKVNHQFYVIEAYDSVQKIPLKQFLNRSNNNLGKPKVLVGRLKRPYRKYIPKALKRAKNFLGLAYDKQFLLNNNAYYCSELVYDVFLTEDHKPIFTVKPMSFTNKETGKIDQTWIDYFAKQNSTVPEGKLGCNPADYSKLDIINIIPIKF